MPDRIAAQLAGDKAPRRTALLSNILAAAIILLLIAFFVLTVRNSAQVNERVNDIESGPYIVSINAGSVETGLVQLRTLAERPIYARTEEAINDVEASYATIDEQLQESVGFIAERHISIDNRERLAAGYAELVAMQAEYIALCRNPEVTDAEVASFAYDRLIPKIDMLLDVDARIFDVANARVEELCEDVDALGRQNIIITCAIMAAVMVALAVYLVLLNRNRKREEALKASLQDALDLAQSASRAKSSFLSNMSHDIRTPMNAIVGLTAIASSHADDPARVRECLDRIEVSSRHLLSLINDVLDMSRIESGKVILHEDELGMRELMDGIDAIVQPQTRAQGIDFAVSMAGVEHDAVIGDKLRLNQAILNLVTNAVKYTAAGGEVRLAVSEEPAAGEGFRTFRFVVRDTGIGMAPEFVARMFEPFEREHNTVTSHTEGVGLGMPITKNFVELMGGSISVESVQGEGTTVVALVPLRVMAEDGAAAAQAGSAAQAEASASAAACGVADAEPSELSDTAAGAAAEGEGDAGILHGRVLLAEDNELNCEIATELIGQFGVEVDQAADGQEALDMLFAAPDGWYGLVFMDMQMPRLSGVEATKRICELFDAEGRVRPPIVAMTANAFDQDREAALSAGMDGFLTKPISIAELERTLRFYLR